MYFASVVLVVPFKLKVIWLRMYVEYMYNNCIYKVNVHNYTIIESNTKKEL